VGGSRRASRGLADIDPKGAAVSDDRLPFLAAIEATPNDTLSRLIYADFLDERYDRDSACQQILAIMHRDVLERPEDDNARLAYADICERYGYVERAQHVRQMCELTSERWFIPENTPAPFPHGFLFVPNGPDELDLVCRDKDRFQRELHRGFISAIHCIAGDWLEYGQHILRRQPIECIMLRDFENCVIKIAKRTDEPPGWTIGLVASTFPSNMHWYKSRSELIDAMPAQLRHLGLDQRAEVE
jgi:uncharacterized protein (TIGR02996 family)